MKKSAIILLVSLILVGLFIGEINEVVGAWSWPWSRRTTTTYTPPTTTCKDTDSQNQYTLGKVTYRGRTYTDRCIDAQRVLEYYCSGNYIKTKYVTCSEGCQNGKCNPKTAIPTPVPQPTPTPLTCTDSDGLNLGVKGYCLHSGAIKIWDTCNWDGKVSEHYCKDNTICADILYDCPINYECKDGACIKKVQTTPTAGEPRTIPSDVDLSTINIEYVDDVDLSDVGLSSAQKAVYIHSPHLNKFNLKGIITASTNEVWLVPQSNTIKVYYRDIESVPNIKYAGDDLHISITNSAGSSIEWRFTVPNSELLVYTENQEDIYAIEAYFKILNGEISALGKITSLAEANELQYKNYEIGTRTTDFYTDVGIIIRSPASRGASDTVMLKVPSRKY